MIEIGNVYGHGFDSASLAQIESLGFALRPEVSHYAGAQVLRFIDFPRGPPLELIRVTDPKAYADFVPEGMVPYCPGINLVLPSRGRVTLEKVAETLSEHRPYRIHVNYDGSPDAAKPGWNYLNFGIPLLRDTFVWLTTLDDPRPRPTHVTTHPNCATSVRGLYLDVDSAELAPLAELVEDEVREGGLEIGGVHLWSKEAIPVEPAFGKKRFPLHAVVLEARNLSGFPPRTEGVGRTTFNAQPAVRVRTRPVCWDLLIVPQRGSTRRTR